MVIRALCLVKNEVDIIAEVLRAASQWCDQIYVFDNGSDDGTWDRVYELVDDLPAVVPFKQDPKPFDDKLRGEILREYRSEAHRGDWWCILDADEFYIDDPRAFLGQIPSYYRAVWPQMYTYLFTDKDAECYRGDRRYREPDKAVTERLKHYVLGQYTQLRFFRHDPRFSHVPINLQPIYPKRIRIGHYGYRSPDQIQVRLETRAEPMRRGEFVHEKRSNWVPGGYALDGPALGSDMPSGWEERIVSHTECFLDAGVETLLAPLPWTAPEPGPVLRDNSLRQFRRKLRNAVGRLSPARGRQTANVDGLP